MGNNKTKQTSNHFEKTAAVRVYIVFNDSSARARWWVMQFHKVISAGGASECAPGDAPKSRHGKRIYKQIQLPNEWGLCLRENFMRLASSARELKKPETVRYI